jgi:hypothetical protein
MNSVVLSEGKRILMKMLCLLKTPRDLQILFAAVTHLVERLSLETLLTLKIESP